MKYLLLLLVFFCVPCLAQDINWDKLIDSVIECESSGNPNAVSEDGCIGLCQISPIVLQEFLQENPLQKDRVFEKEMLGKYGPEKWYFITDMSQMYIPKANIKVGEFYLHRLHEHYGCNTIEKILMAYNYGISASKKIDFDINRAPKETQNYIKKVIRLYEQ